MRTKTLSGLFEPKNLQGKTCKTCKHRQRWGFHHTDKVFQYCGIRASGRTQNGLLKIKCKNPACGSYEEEIEEPNKQTEEFKR